MAIKTFIQIRVSEKGKDFKGEKLTEDSFDEMPYILYDNDIFYVGNRRANRVELFQRGFFQKTVDSKYVQLLDI